MASAAAVQLETEPKTYSVPAAPADSRTIDWMVTGPVLFVSVTETGCVTKLPTGMAVKVLLDIVKL